MALQDIIDSAVNIEVNRSKLVAQTVSRSGRISTASRNWANPFRFTVTPKPIWTAAEYRSVFASLLDNDKYLPHGFYLNNVDPTTFQADLGNSWMVPYQGGADSNGNNVIDSYGASSETSGAMICLTNTNSGTITAGTYIAKEGDYLRLGNYRYPYIATSDVVIPTAATAVTGTIQPAGVTVYLEPSVAGVFPGNNLSFVSTTTRTSITGITDTSGLSVGQIITSTGAYSKTYVSGGAPGAFTVTLNNVTSLSIGMKVFGTGLASGALITNIAGSQLTLDTAFTIQATGTYTIGGAVGGLTYIAAIPSPTFIVIQSTTACTSGSITFDGTGPTSTPTVCVPVHRGFIGTVTTTASVLVGARAAQFVVNVAVLPQVRYLPGGFVELTSDIELIEEIL